MLSWRIVILRRRRRYCSGIGDERRCGNGFRQDRLKRSRRGDDPNHPLASAGVRVVVVVLPVGVVRVSGPMSMGEPGRMFVMGIPKMNVVERSPSERE
jgi:hypothetical protein